MSRIHTVPAGLIHSNLSPKPHLFCAFAFIFVIATILVLGSTTDIAARTLLVQHDHGNKHEAGSEAQDARHLQKLAGSHERLDKDKLISRVRCCVTLVSCDVV